MQERMTVRHSLAPAAPSLGTTVDRRTFLGTTAGLVDAFWLTGLARSLDSGYPYPAAGACPAEDPRLPRR